MEIFDYLGALASRSVYVKIKQRMLYVKHETQYFIILNTY